MRVPGVTFIQGCNGRGSMDPCAVAIHATANTASAANEASYATRRPDGIGAHFYVDATRVIQSLDTAVYTAHAGSSNGNRNAIAVEITGLNSWSRDRWLQEVDWAELGHVLAQVCRAHGIPAQRRTVAEMKAGGGRTRGFYTHNDMRLAWGGTDHTDPGGNFPFDRLLQAVSAALGGAPASTEGNDVSTTTDNIIAAWARGGTEVPGFGSIEPPKWRARDEAWQAQTTAVLAAIAAKVDIDASELAAIRDAAKAGVDEALAAGQERLIAAIVQAVGGVVAGDGNVDDTAVEAAVRRVFADAGSAS